MSDRNAKHDAPGDEALGKVLRAEAERGFPRPVGLWPTIRGRLENAPPVEAPAPRASRRPSPRGFRSRLGSVAAAVVALVFFGGVAYATGGIGDALQGVFSDTAPNVRGTQVDARKSRGDLTVTIERVYADSGYVAVGYTVEGMQDLGGRAGGVSSWLKLTEPGGAANGAEYAIADGRWAAWSEEARGPVPPRGSQAGAVLFEAPGILRAGERHRLRAEVYFDGRTGRTLKNGALEVKRIGKPFFFDFEVPVKTAPVIKLDQTVEARGVSITLARVVNSPVKTSAHLCFDPPQGTYDWPLVKTRLFETARLAEVPVYHTEGSGAAEDGCATYRFEEPLYNDPGTHSLTVTELHSGDPDAGAIVGPWRFRFEVRAPPAE